MKEADSTQSLNPVTDGLGWPCLRSWNWLSSLSLHDIHQLKASAGEHHADSERGASSTNTSKFTAQWVTNP